MEIKFTWTRGGTMGGHYMVMANDKCVGHFYPDAEKGVDVDAVIQLMEKSPSQEKKLLTCTSTML